MGIVYLIGDWEKEDCYKIGVTRGSLENRLKKLQTGNGGELYVITSFETEYPFRMEKMLHTKFANERMEGEWFHLSNEDASHFHSICEDIQKTIEALKENYYFKKDLR